MTANRSMTSRVPRLALVAGALLGAWALWAWLDDDAGIEPAALAPPAAPVDASMDLDALRAEESALAAAPLQATAVEADPGHRAAAEDWPAGVERVCLSGRVVDARGSAWPGARVWFAPDRDTRRAISHVAQQTGLYDVVPPVFAARQPLHGLPRTTTGPDGRFEICGPRLGDAGASWSARDPQVLVTAPGMALQGHDAAGFRGHSMDLGDVVLEHEASGLTLRVIDEQGAPIPGVEYRTFASGGQMDADDDPVPAMAVGLGLLGTTDAHGRMTLDHLWPIGLHGALHASGFEDHVLRVELGLGEFRDLGDIVLGRGRSLAGTLVDASGAPISGALVLGLHAERLRDAVDDEPGALDAAALLRVATAETPMRARSDADGRFVLSAIPANMPAVTLLATAPGHRPAHVPAATPGEEVPPLVLPAEARLRVDLRSAAGGAPLTDGRLLAFRLAREDPERKPGSDLMHALRGTWLPLEVEGDVVHDPGPLGTLLLASAPGHLPLRVDVEPCAAGELRELTVALQPGPGVRGTVVDDLGAPIAGALVRLTASGTRGLRLRDEECLSDADGTFAFGPIPAGAWRLAARCSGYVALDGFARQLVDVDSTVAAEPLELVLPRSARLPGRLLEADGSPAVASWVNAHAPDDPEDNRMASARSDREGHFEFRDLTPGPWLLRAGLAPPLPVELAVGDNPPVELRLPPRVWLRGRTRSGDDPLAQVRVQASRSDSDDDPSPRSTRSDRDGVFALELPEAGLYDVLLASREGPRTGRQVEVRAGDPPQLDVDFGTGRITGRVLFDRSIVPDWARGIRLLRDGRWNDNAELDDRGAFAFAPLTAGEYEVKLHMHGYLPLSVPVELRDGERRDDLLLEPLGGTRLVGAIRHADGTPFEGYVHLRRTDGEPGYEVLELDDGELYDDTIAPGAWRLDLATFWQQELGIGEGRRGEPGVELPLYARREFVAEPLQELELDIVIPGPRER